MVNVRVDKSPNPMMPRGDKENRPEDRCGGPQSHRTGGGRGMDSNQAARGGL